MVRRLNTLPGYDARLEERRRFYKRRFDIADNNAERREAFRKLASVTALRSATFISAYEFELGIGDG